MTRQLNSIPNWFHFAEEYCTNDISLLRFCALLIAYYYQTFIVAEFEMADRIRKRLKGRAILIFVTGLDIHFGLTGRS